MLQVDEYSQAIEITSSSVEKATQAFVTMNILLTVMFALSLKSMWNLMNVIQVLAYLRFFTSWPALMMEVLTHLDNAITLKPVTDPIFEYGLTQFEKANATLSDEVMKNTGVQDSKMTQSLGIFALIYNSLPRHFCKHYQNAITIVNVD